MSPTTAALVALVAALSLAPAGWADSRRIAILEPDGELFRAVSLALAPWGLETMGSNARVPGSAQPEAARAASRLARELEVEALVWVTSHQQGSLLWVFDVRTGDVTTRQLPQTPPFDSASAAAVALSVKTVLRASFVAPPEERFGARSSPPSVPPVATAEDVAAVEFGPSGHWLSERAVDFRFDLSGVIWIPSARRVGFSLELSSGPGLGIDTPDYEGRYRELVLGAKARFRIVDLPRFSTVVALGGAAHWATLQGELVADSRDRDVRRVNGTVELDASLNFYVSSSVYLGASIGVAYSPSYRRYLVDGTPVFTPWPVTPHLNGYSGVELF